MDQEKKCIRELVKLAKNLDRINLNNLNADNLSHLKDSLKLFSETNTKLNELIYTPDGKPRSILPAEEPLDQIITRIVLAVHENAPKADKTDVRTAGFPAENRPTLKALFPEFMAVLATFAAGSRVPFEFVHNSRVFIEEFDRLSGAIFAPDLDRIDQFLDPRIAFLELTKFADIITNRKQEYTFYFLLMF
jgi:hypothetical protein